MYLNYYSKAYHSSFLLAANVAPINPGSIPSVLNLVTNNTHHANRTSVGGGISPVNFALNTQVRN